MVVFLLIAGCAEDDDVSGFSAGPVGPTSTATLGIVTITSAPDAYECTDGASGDAGTTDAAAPTTGADASGSTAESGGPGESGEQGTGDAGEIDSTSGAVSSGGDTDDEPGIPDIPSFADHVWPIFDASCSCHKDANGAGQLRMKVDDAYINLVEVPAEQLPMMMLVQPGAPEQSYLWQKLNDTQQDVGGEGKRMPSSGLLEEAELDLIELWIVAGAEP
jgi:hypothetical protein